MRILIDGDGCPVIDKAITIAASFAVECLILCDTSHVFTKKGATTIQFSKGPDSVDFALVNMVKKDDIVITQDYGLAAMCLARLARVISQNGREYNDSNIDALLLARHTAKKIRMAGGRLKGPKKRNNSQDTDFAAKLQAIIEEINSKDKMQKSTNSKKN